MASFLMGSLSPTNVLLFFEKGTLFDVIYALRHNRMIFLGWNARFVFLYVFLEVDIYHLHKMSGKI